MPRRAQSNGYIERLNRTLKKEFLLYPLEELVTTIGALNRKLMQRLEFDTTRKPYNSLSLRPSLNTIEEGNFPRMLWTCTNFIVKYYVMINFGNKKELKQFGYLPNMRVYQTALDINELGEPVAALESFLNTNTYTLTRVSKEVMGMPNKLITLSIEAKIYEKYREYCDKKGFIISKYAEKFHEK